MASAERGISASSSVSSRPVQPLIAWKKSAPISRGTRRRLGICNTYLIMTPASWPRSRTSSLLTLGTVPSRNCLSSGVTRTSSPKSNEHRHSVQWKGRPSYIRYSCERKECRSRTAGSCRTKPFSRCVSDWLVRVDTGNRIVAALNSAPFQVASIYAAEPRESSFTPSGRSSPLGDTCR